jgi:hypothetical protein
MCECEWNRRSRKLSRKGGGTTNTTYCRLHQARMRGRELVFADNLRLCSRRKLAVVRAYGSQCVEDKYAIPNFGKISKLFFEWTSFRGLPPTYTDYWYGLSNGYEYLGELLRS